MSFHDPWFLFLIPVAAGLLWLSHRRKKSPGVRFSSGELLRGLHESIRIKLSRNIILLRIFSSLLIVLALARPQTLIEESTRKAGGIDIILAVDVSTSMLAEDFEIGLKRMNRIEAVKGVIKDFVRGRKDDRIGMVVFAARAYPLCPLTRDHEWLLQNLDRAESGMLDDGTALGSGLSSALNRLRYTPAKGKVIILLTDGRNNAGKIDPLAAAAAARALKIKVYTIGAGSKGPAPYPLKDPFGRTIYKPLHLEVDENTLKLIALQTEARYFRATDTTALREIFKEIDRLERTPVEEKVYYARAELFHFFLVPGMVLLFLEFIFRNSFLRKIP